MLAGWWCQNFVLKVSFARLESPFSESDSSVMFFGAAVAGKRLAVKNLSGPEKTLATL